MAIHFTESSPTSRNGVLSISRTSQALASSSRPWASSGWESAAFATLPRKVVDGPVGRAGTGRRASTDLTVGEPKRTWDAAATLAPVAVDDTQPGPEPRAIEAVEAEGAGGDAIIGATMEGLRRAAEEVEHVAALAETLQRSLLPERLPEIAGLGLAARYVAGSAEAQVGGDWYDVIPLRDGQIGIAIGDVVGHGLGAAARMASLQNALRAYALEGLRPSLVLERMNGFARELEGGPMATLLYAVIDPDEARMRIASAGHPPPLVIAPGGDASFAEGPTASPLGVVSFPTYEESIVALAAGSTVLLYTDGLVERPDASLDEGLEWLRDFARGVPVRAGRAVRGVAAGALQLPGAAGRRRAARAAPRAAAADSRSSSP